MVSAPLGLSLLLAKMAAAADMDDADAYAACYVLFHVTFEFMRVVCDAQGARCVASTRMRGAPRFAAVSGLNTTLCLVLQVVLQLGFQITRGPSHNSDAIAQFRVLAALLLALFLCYAALASGRALCILCRGADDETADNGYRRFADEARADSILKTVLRW